jgi:hypothetical protein
LRGEREQKCGEMGMEQSLEADEDKQRAKALKQTKILIRISALILLLPLTYIGPLLLYVVSNTPTLINTLILIFTLTMIGILLYIAVTK